MRTFLAGLAVVAFGVVVFFGLFEIGARIVFHNSMDFDIEMWKYATTVKNDVADPEIGHEHKPGARAFLMGVDVAINANKLRDREIGFAKPAGVKRVLMLGDSLTFGWGVPAESTPSRLVEKALNAASEGEWQVINAGVGNYNTSQEVAYFLREGHRFDPDVVVLNYFINDAEPTPHRKTNLFSEWSYAYVYLMGRLDILGRQAFGKQDWAEYYRGLYGDDHPGWRTAVKSIERLAAFCRERNISLVIAHYPELHDLKNYRFAAVSDLLKALADRLGARFVDLLPAVRGENEAALWVTPTDAHPNERANRLFAKTLLLEIAAVVRP
jgi:lysophospholipase L1-like esterase